MGEVCSWTEIYFFENMSTLEGQIKMPSIFASPAKHRRHTFRPCLEPPFFLLAIKIRPKRE